LQKHLKIILKNLKIVIVLGLKQKKQTEAILEYSKQITEIQKVTGETKSNTDEILKTVKALKKEKKDGLWENIGAKDKKKNVREGIKTIGLMAGGILAIGSAFKLVGEVDWKSVMALSIALPAMSYSFNKVGETTTDPKTALNIAGVMIAMSGGVAVSGMLLQNTPSLGFAQIVSIIGISAGLGIVLYGLSKISNELDSKSVQNIYALVPVLPVLAASISAAGMVLQSVPTVTLGQVLSTIGIGIALGGALIPLAIAAKFADMKKATDMMVLAGTMPVLAASLVASAFALQYMPTDLPYGSIIGGSFAISLAIGAFATPIAILSKMKVSFKDILLGTAGMVIMSGGLMAMSHILSFGNYEEGSYPTASWATGVGLSMLGFVPAVVLTGAIAATGVGALVLMAGIASMLGISSGLAQMSHILAKGKYDKHPSVEWAAGTGSALMAFIGPMMALQGGLFSMLFGASLEDKVAMVEQLGEALQKTSITVSKGKYTGGPKKEWAEGIGVALSVFANSLDLIEPGIIGSIFGQTLESRLASMLKIAQYLPKLGNAVGSDTSMYSGGPKKEWSEGVGIAIMTFAESLDLIDPGVLGKIFGKSLDGQLQGMLKIAQYLPKFGIAVGSDTSMYSGGPKKEWSEGVSIAVTAFAEGLSMIDPGMFDMILGKTLDSQLQGMLKIAMYLPKFGLAVGSDTSMYQGGPSKEWAESVAATITGFVTALDIVEGGVMGPLFNKSLDEKLFGLAQIAKMIPFYGNTLAKGSYTNFPSDQWVNGVIAFIDGFTSIDGLDKDFMWKNILRLSVSYNHLAKSITKVGKALNSIKATEMPDLGGLYSGLVTLSLIDNNNLNKVLTSLNNNWNILDDYVSLVKMKTDNSAYSNPNLMGKWNQPKYKEEKTQSNAALSSGGSSGSSVQSVSSSSQAQSINVNVDSLKQELSANSELLQQMINLLGEIADNTGGFGFTSNISN
jgi:hypothetical protein